MGDSLTNDVDDVAMKSYLDPTLTPAALEVVICDESSEIDCRDEGTAPMGHDIQVHSADSEFRVDYDPQHGVPKHQDDHQSVSTSVSLVETNPMESVHCFTGPMDLVKVEPQDLQSELTKKPTVESSGHPMEAVHCFTGPMDLAKVEPQDLQSELSKKPTVESSGHRSETIKCCSSVPSDQHMTLGSFESIFPATTSHSQLEVEQTLKTIIKHENAGERSHVTDDSRHLTVVHPSMISGLDAVTFNRTISHTNRPIGVHDFLRLHGQIPGSSALLPTAMGVPTHMFKSQTGYSSDSRHSNTLDVAKRDKMVSAGGRSMSTEYSLHMEDTTVPDVVAMETVVTTDVTKKQGVSMGNNCATTLVLTGDTSHVFVSHAVGDASQLAGDAMLPAIGSDVDGEASESGSSMSESHGKPVVASNNGNILQVSITNLTKRERDKLKKREQRSCPDYREREKLIARERMRRVRANAAYRDTERFKDRIRRRQSRQANPMARAMERERDKQSKRLQRIETSSQQIVPVDSLQEVTDQLIF